MLAYLSDAIARVVISGLSSALLVGSATSAARSAAVLVLLFCAASVLQLQQTRLGNPLVERLERHTGRCSARISSRLRSMIAAVRGNIVRVLSKK